MLKGVLSSGVQAAPRHLLGSFSLCIRGSIAAYMWYCFIASWKRSGLFSFETVLICLTLSIAYGVGRMLYNGAREAIAFVLVKLGILTPTTAQAEVKKPAASAGGMGGLLGSMLGGGAGGGDGFSAMADMMAGMDPNMLI